jgi:hypothetical protein
MLGRNLGWIYTLYRGGYKLGYILDGGKSSLHRPKKELGDDKPAIRVRRCGENLERHGILVKLQAKQAA